MTKEKLTEWGLTEEQAKKVMDGLNGSFVTKSRFNEVNTELAASKKTVEERDKQLEELKKAGGDSEALKKQIEELQKDNKAQKTAHEAELKSLRVGNAVELALSLAKAKNNTAVKALMADFLAKAELAEDGSVKGLSEEVKRLTEGKDTAFLFETAQSGGRMKGAKAAEKGEPTGGSGEELSKMTYDELCAYLADNPEAEL